VRQIIKLLLVVTDIAILILGLLFSLGLGLVLDSEFYWGMLALIPFFLSLSLTIVIFLWFRRKARKREIENDAAIWMAGRAWGRLHPRRAEYLRMLRRNLLWFPSICAAVVFFFLPAVSHVVCSGHHLVSHYRFSTPLNWTIIKIPGYDSVAWAYFSDEGAARYGFSPIWFSHSMPSSVAIESADPASLFTWWRPEHEVAIGHPTETAKTEFMIGTIEMNCWEYQDAHAYYDGLGYSSNHVVSAFRWEVLCSTRPNGRDFNLHASFLGRKEDVPSFYNVLKGASLSQ
jgi:hypothetical protein